MCSSILKVLTLTFRSRINFELIFSCMVWGRNPSSFFFFFFLVCGYPVVQHHLLKRPFFLNKIDLPYGRKSISHKCKVYFWNLNSIPLIYTSILMLVWHCLQYYSFLVSFKSGNGRFPVLFIFHKNCFGYSGYLPCISTWIFGLVVQFLQKKKRSSWNFDRDCVESIDRFGEYCHLDNIKSSD